MYTKSHTDGYIINILKIIDMNVESIDILKNTRLLEKRDCFYHNQNKMINIFLSDLKY